MAAEILPILPTYYFQIDSSSEETRAKRMHITGVDDDHHGMYETRTYYGFVDATSFDGKRYLVSDDGLKAELIYVEGSATIPDEVWKAPTTKYRVDLPEFDGLPPVDDEVILSINDPSMASPGTTPINGFIISGTPRDHPLLPSGTFDENKHYVRARPRADRVPPKGGDAGPTYGNVFTHKKYNLDQIQGAWDVRTMDPEDFQKTGSQTPLFKALDDDSHNFEQEGDGNLVPYGWIFDHRSVSSGTSNSTMISSSSDVMSSTMKSSGFKVGAGFEFDYGVVQAEGEFSVTNNKSVTDKIENLYSSESTSSEHRYLITEAAYILDKINVRLSDTRHDDTSGGLRGEIDKLKNSADANGLVSVGALEGFTRIFGTHYCYAAVFGAKGYAFETYSKTATEQLAEKNVDVSTAWDAKLSTTVFGQKAKVSVGGDERTVTDNLNKYNGASSSSFASFNCVGSGMCHGGEPGSGDRVPVLVDLRPVSDLLGPPFYNDPIVTIAVREQLEAYIKKVCFVAPPPAQRGNSLSPSNELGLTDFTIRTVEPSLLKSFQANVTLPTQGLEKLQTGGVTYQRPEAIKQFAAPDGSANLSLPAFTFDGTNHRRNGIVVTYGAELDPIPVGIYCLLKVDADFHPDRAPGHRGEHPVHLTYQQAATFNVGPDASTTDRNFSCNFGELTRARQWGVFGIFTDYPHTEFAVLNGQIDFHFQFSQIDSVAKLRQLQRSALTTRT